MQIPVAGKGGPDDQTAPRRRGRLRWRTSIVLGIASLIAWFAPDAKPDGVLGRLNFLQFWTAVVLSAATITAILLARTPREQRRVAGFKAAAIWLGLGLALLASELTAYVLPVRHLMDNPWYLAAGGGASVAEDLPYGRPAHLKWSGLSRGDLAVMNGDDDPYARSITFETDMEGFHNGTDLSQADVVVVGDSFAEAGNLPETENFPSLIGKKLGVKSRNLGRAGYTAPTELVVLKKYGLRCRPKTVVWQVAESNDLSEAVDHEAWLANGRPPYFGIWKKGRKTRAEAWPERSPAHLLFSLLRNHDPRPWPYGGIFKDRTGMENPIRFVWESALDQPARGHPGWHTLSSALAEGAELCRTNGIRLIVVLIPMKVRVLGPVTAMPSEAITRTTSAPGFPEQVAIGPLLKEFCAGNGISFVDTTAALQKKAAEGELVYLPFDTHLSSAGHEVLAELMVKKLKTNSENAVPPTRP